jgi:HK97 gp10 family phage protein
MSRGPSIQFQMQGLAQLTTRFKALSGAAQGKTIRASMRAMGTPVKKKVISQAPYDGVTPDNTHIRDNVVLGRSRSRSTNGCEVWTVGIKLGKKTLKSGKTVKTEGDAWYWKLVEFGTSKMPSYPFIRPAAAAAAAEALEAFKKKFGEAITKAERQTSGPP